MEPDWGVEADLALEVTGPGGHTVAQLHGYGRQWRLRADRPEAVLAAATGPTRAGVIDLLGSAGISAELRGPRGRVASFDPHRRSRVAALLWGSPHLRADPAGWAVFARAAPRPQWSQRRHPTPHLPARVALLGGAVTITAALALRLRRRRGYSRGW